MVAEGPLGEGKVDLPTLDHLPVLVQVVGLVIAAAGIALTYPFMKRFTRLAFTVVCVLLIAAAWGLDQQALQTLDDMNIYTVRGAGEPITLRQQHGKGVIDRGRRVGNREDYRPLYATTWRRWKWNLPSLPP